MSTTTTLMIRITGEGDAKQVWVPAAALMELILSEGVAFKREYVSGGHVWKHLPTPEVDLPSFAVSTSAALTAMIAAERITK